MARLLKLALEEITLECEDNAVRSHISNNTSRRVHEGFSLGPHRHGSTRVSEVEARSETLFRRMRSYRRSSGTRLYVSNLDLRVTDRVIELMFSGVGKLISHLVHHDESGNSKGTADVVYMHRSDALEAMKRYQSKPIKGKPLVIQLAHPSRCYLDKECRREGIMRRWSEENEAKSRRALGKKP